MKKSRFSVSAVRGYPEPGPVVLISSRRGNKNNLMMPGWHSLLKFSHRLSAV